MQALPRQLAVGIVDRITLQRKLIELNRDGPGWQASDGAHAIGARHVVVATDPVTAEHFTGVKVPPMHGVVTDWWATDDVPPGPSMLWVDGRADPAGPVLNTSVISAAAPTYAPAG